MTSQNDSKQGIEQLKKQIRDLEDQVKKLVAGELNQYDLQAKLDIQLRSQAELVRLSQRLQIGLDESRIGALVAEALVENLDYEKAAVCLLDPYKGEFSLVGLEGYYKGSEEKAVRESMSDLIDFIGINENDEIKIEKEMSRSVAGMGARVGISLRSGKGELFGFVVFGNSRKRAAFHRRIDPIDRSMWETIKGITTSAFEHSRLYNQLAAERESLKKARDNLEELNEKLEEIILERTRELAESKDEYRQLYLESERTGELYLTLLDSSPDPIVVYDIKGIPVYLNPAFSRVFGWRFEEVKGKRIDFVPPENRLETDELIAKVVKRGEKFSNHETRRYTKDGRVIDVSISGATYSSESGQLMGSVIHLRDITNQKRMEEELLKVHKLESVGVLAGGIAHDFNNILSGILMSAQLMEVKLEQNEDVGKYLTGIQEATQKAVALTQQLLTFAKGGAPVMKTASIAKVIKDWAGFVLRGSRVRCVFDISDDLMPVEIDEGQMTQVIHNLIRNAEQAMPEGGIIKIRAGNIDVQLKEIEPTLIKLGEGEYVRISIKDSGEGIPAENLSKIFDPYFTTKEDGAGLGLATTFSIIRKHKGYLTVESEPGKGTEFHIFLPASRVKLDKKDDGKGEESLGKGKGKILLMDDEEMLRQIGGDILLALGYEVESADNGEKAIQMYMKARDSHKPFDLVIMDLTVPGGMGGKETMKRLLEMDPQVKAIVSSGYSNDPVMSDFRSYGFKGVLVKPYKLKDVDKLLEGILNKTKPSL